MNDAAAAWKGDGGDGGFFSGAAGGAVGVAKANVNRRSGVGCIAIARAKACRRAAGAQAIISSGQGSDLDGPVRAPRRSIHSSMQAPRLQNLTELSASSMLQTRCCIV